MFTLKAFTQSLGSGCWSVAKSSLCDSVNPWPSAYQASLSFTISWSLLKLKFIESVMLPKNVTLCCHLLILPSIFPNIRVFSNESALRIRWTKYWSSSFSVSPSNEHSGLISFKSDWFDLFAVQGTLKSIHQHHNLEATIFQHSAFFMVQLSHPYMTTGKTTALTRRTFVSNVTQSCTAGGAGIALKPTAGGKSWRWRFGSHRA